MLKGGLTPSRRCAGNSGSFRLQIALAIKLLASWHSLTSAHPPSSHRRVLSDFDHSTYETDFGRKQQSTAIRTDRLSSFSENGVPSHASAKNTPDRFQPRVIRHIWSRSTWFAEELSLLITRSAARSSIRLRVLVSDGTSASMARHGCRASCSRPANCCSVALILSASSSISRPIYRRVL